MSQMLRVIVRQESDGKRKFWVAFALEQFIASQSSGGYFDAVCDLGGMLDRRDAIVAEYAKAGTSVEPIPPAPADLQALWDRAEPGATMSLGAKRWAEVRKLRTP